MTPEERVSTVLMALAGLSCILFVSGYLVRSRWWRNEAGLNTMALMSVIAVFLVLGFYYRVSGDLAPEWLRSLMWALINIPLWWRVVILYRAQHGAYPVTHPCTACGKPCDGS